MDKINCLKIYSNINCILLYVFLVYKLQVNHRYILFSFIRYRYCYNTSVYIIIGDHYYNVFYSLNAYCMYVYYLIHVCCIFCGAIKKIKNKKYYYYYHYTTTTTATTTTTTTATTTATTTINITTITTTTTSNTTTTTTTSNRKTRIFYIFLQLLLPLLL